MMEYPKIDSVYLRDPETNHRTFRAGAWTRPEFGYLAACDWIATEKVDGTNIRIYRDSVPNIAGRTDKAQLPPKLVPRLQEILVRFTEADLPADAVLYGEGYGASIQKGGHYLPDSTDFVLFDVVMGGNWQPRGTVSDVAEMVGVRAVPVLGVAPLPVWVAEIEGGKWAESQLHDGARNEGLVLRPAVELADRTGRRIITKVKFRDFPGS